MQVPNGHTRRGWLGGKALPLTFITLLVAARAPVLLRETVSLVYNGIDLYPTLELLHRYLTLGFLILLVVAYLIRAQAAAPAHGPWERVFPILAFFACSAGLWFLGRSELSYRWDLVGIGLPLTLLGYGLSLSGLWHLRGSFAIMAEARRLVMSGPYQYSRHPLYLGEAITMLGLCLMIGTTVALLFWATLTALQLMRARIEEGKLASQFEDHRAYREKIRFILPGFYQSSGMLLLL